MRDRSNVRYPVDFQTNCIQGANGRITTWTRALDENIDLFQSVLLCRTARVLSGNLSGKRRAFATPPKTRSTGCGPRQRVAMTVGNRDNRIVKRRVNMCDTLGN